MTDKIKVIATAMMFVLAVFTFVQQSTIGVLADSCYDDAIQWCESRCSGDCLAHCMECEGCLCYHDWDYCAPNCSY